LMVDIPSNSGRTLETAVAKPNKLLEFDIAKPDRGLLVARLLLRRPFLFGLDRGTRALRRVPFPLRDPLERLLFAMRIKELKTGIIGL
jgi:hypothetical protein